MPAGEVDSLLTQAADCAEGECSVDEVSDLLLVLKGQQKDLYSRVQQAKDTISTLETVNEKSDREVDEVRETVRHLPRLPARSQGQ